MEANSDEQEVQVRYLATVDIRPNGNAGGCAVDFYPDERLAMAHEYGPWPNPRVLGEFATEEEADAGLWKRLERYAAGFRGWKTRRRNQQSKAV